MSKKEKNNNGKISGISGLRSHFYRNQTPFFFVSATNFNLLGIDEWVKNFKYINYIDCFDGKHPNVFVPSEMPHATFTSIEDINNYLLEHKEVIDFMKARGQGARAVFLMFDDKTEAICKELGIEVAFPPAKLRAEVDNKISGTRIGNRAGVPSVPNALGKVRSYSELLALAKTADLGDDLVVQTAFGDSGHTTYFIKSEEDYQKHAAEIAREPEIKVMKRIRCRQAAIEGCVTRHGTIVGPLMTELVGFKELTPYRGGWCGNEVLPKPFTKTVRREARDYTFKFGEELRRMGYRGYFELDYLIDLDADEVYLGEINPRITGASSMTNLASFAQADMPLFLFHLLEFSGVDFKLDVEKINERWSRPENIDTWGQLVMKFTEDKIDVITEAPASGIWRLKEGGGIEHVSGERHRRYAENESEAFFLRISGKGDYRYEGCDLGILVTPGRLMDDEFRLTDRARAWIDGIHRQYQAKPVTPGEPAHPAVPAKMGRFKIL
jgi:hypothetical protein